MRSLLSLLLLTSSVAGNELAQVLSPQCFNETKTINDDPGFRQANNDMTTTISSIQTASYCNFDDKTNPEILTLFCNLYYNKDIPNTIEEECKKLGGDYEEVGIFFDCKLGANSETGAKATRLYSTHHDVPTCTGSSCTPTELRKYSEQYFEYLESTYRNFNCEISYSDPLASSASSKNVAKVLSLILFCYAAILL